MKFKHICVLSLLLALSTFWGSPAQALEKGGVSFPDQAQVAGKTLKLNGLGVRKATIFKVSVYVAALYLEAKSGKSAEILSSPGVKRLEMHFVRDVKADKIRGAWSESFAKTCPPSCDTLNPLLSQFNGWMADMKTGDTMALTFFNDHVEVSVKGQTVGVLQHKSISNVLLAIWLGAEPPNASLKEGLLGQES